jgi:hypothetical protein
MGSDVDWGDAQGTVASGVEIDVATSLVVSNLPPQPKAIDAATNTPSPNASLRMRG